MISSDGCQKVLSSLSLLSLFLCSSLPFPLIVSHSPLPTIESPGEGSRGKYNKKGKQKSLFDKGVTSNTHSVGLCPDGGNLLLVSFSMEFIVSPFLSLTKSILTQFPPLPTSDCEMTKERTRKQQKKLFTNYHNFRI